MTVIVYASTDFKNIKKKGNCMHSGPFQSLKRCSAFLALEFHQSLFNNADTIHELILGHHEWRGKSNYVAVGRLG